MCRSKIIFALGVVLAACAITPKEQKLREDASQPSITASRDWNGEAITIHNAGLSPDPGAGGVEIHVSPTATRVSIEAVFAAWADNDLQHHAEHAIQEVIASLILEETERSFDITCGQGQKYGTTRAGGSGCRTLRVTIPSGSAEHPHAITIVTGSGSVVFTGEPSWVHRVIVDTRSGLGSIEASFQPVEGAVMSLAGYNTINVSLPSDFSAKHVSFALSDPAYADPSRGVVVTDFPGMANGAAYPVSGPKAGAADTLRLATASRLQPELIQVRHVVPKPE